MIKKIYTLLTSIISIFVGWYVYFWFISNPFETYTLPIIIIWLPDVIGWNNFFVAIGFFAGLIIGGLFISIYEFFTKD